MKICVLGDSGLLGQSLVQKLAKHNEVLGISSSDFRAGRFWKGAHALRYHHHTCDILEDEGRFFSLLKRFAADLYINCVGLVDVDVCERMPAMAQTLNAVFPGKLAQFVRTGGTRLIHISTDQVFDGKKKTPYKETDTPKPLNVYGLTKRAGESAVLENDPLALVVRTNLVGFRDREHKPTFAEWLCQALVHSEKITLADDFITSSIHVRDLADILWKTHHKKLYGLLHVATHDSASKYDFGRLLAARLKVNLKNVKCGTLADLDLHPARPPHLAIDSRRAERLLGLKMPGITDTIHAIASDFRHRSKELNHAC